MQRIRDVLRTSLARSLRTLTEEDRLSAALPVVCTGALGSHCEVSRLGDDRTLHLRVDAPEWLPSLLGMRDHLQHDLQRVSGVTLRGLHFVQAVPVPDRVPSPSPREAAATAQEKQPRPNTFKGDPA